MDIQLIWTEFVFLLHITLFNLIEETDAVRGLGTERTKRMKRIVKEYQQTFKEAEEHGYRIHKVEDTESFNLQRIKSISY